MSEHLKFSGQPELHRSSLVVGWSEDGSKLGTRVINYLNKKLGGQSFCEIEPVDFFPLGGVTIEDDIAQFPESKFYVCPGHDLVVFKSNPPRGEWYKFLNLVLDVAENYCHVKELHTFGAMVSLAAHTTPRELLCTFNSPEIKSDLSPYGLGRDWDFETPPGQRPTLNSFLLWAARRRNIPAVNLWVPIPFYLSTVADPKAQKKILEFLNQRLSLELDFNELNEEISWQSQKIARVRNDFPDINESINRLESNLMLSEEENAKLIRQIEASLGEKNTRAE
ncbi:MAG: PAC2 family protein [Dehalococcoidales bacterium]|nr:PAC2 family protein [Dehalococcoidales bacterium]